MNIGLVRICFKSVNRTSTLIEELDIQTNQIYYVGKTNTE